MFSIKILIINNKKPILIGREFIIHRASLKEARNALLSIHTLGFNGYKATATL